MAKHNRKGRSRRATGFMMVEHGLTKCPAFIAAHGQSVKLLLGVGSRHDGKNNGQISYSVREAAELLHCTKNTAARRFAELVELGFLAPVVKGAFSVKIKKATTWRLTTEPCNGQAPTRDYQRWRPPATVSPRDTDDDHKKQNTVSPRDAVGTRQRYRDPENEPQNGPTVSLSDTEDSQDERLTVPLSDTHIDLAIPRADAWTAPEVPDGGLAVSVAVLRSPLSSAARRPQGCERVRAPAPDKINLSAVLARRQKSAQA